MKAKILALLLGLFISTGVFACPTGTLGPQNKLNWLVGGQFKNSPVGVAVFGRGVRPFIGVTNRISNYLVSNNIEAGRWFIGGRAAGTNVFRYAGRGTSSFVGAVKDAQSILVPI